MPGEKAGVTLCTGTAVMAGARGTHSSPSAKSGMLCPFMHRHDHATSRRRGASSPSRSTSTQGLTPACNRRVTAVRRSLGCCDVHSCSAAKVTQPSSFITHTHRTIYAHHTSATCTPSAAKLSASGCGRDARSSTSVPRHHDQDHTKLEEEHGEETTYLYRAQKTRARTHARGQKESRGREG